ncbi:MAG: hypothetical protein JWO92_2177 [Chitinophagaceae bacterium]|nr:hypothetical protein [Chitinophagaceae bacterium]MDB5221479.1 hypothetical protein [Chitinophagaceae bacterium]
MSRIKFLNDLDQFLEKKNDKKKYETLEELFAEVGKSWMRDKRYKELISFIHDEYDTGQFNSFVDNVEGVLLRENLAQEFKILWKGILKMRLERLWDYKKDYEADAKSEIRKKRLQEQQEYTLAGINKFLQGLIQLNDTDEIYKIQSLKLTVEKLERPKPEPTTDKRKIDELIFWELIDTSRRTTTSKLDFLELLRKKLEAFSPNEIRRFNKILLIKLNELNTWDNWALAYIYRRGCGDDEFDYFKAWVVSKGQFAFDTIKIFQTEKFESLLNSEDPQFEEFLYTANDAYEAKTNDIMKPLKIKRQKLIGKEWSENNLTNQYPELCKMFGYKN